MANDTHADNDNTEFTGDVFNAYDNSSPHAGPIPGPLVDTPSDDTSLHYNLSQMTTKAQRNLIEQTGVMAFHSIGDTGNDHAHRHNGNPFDRQDVADIMVQQCVKGAGKAETPCFCYHVGDIIYPESSVDRYENEFYQPYSTYSNAIVAVPGNHDYSSFESHQYNDPLYSYKLNFVAKTMENDPNKKHRPRMNLSGTYWVLDTPLATIIGLAVVSNGAITTEQSHWFENEMKQADANKALIIAVHYPPYCFDGSDNWHIRNVINNGILIAGRKPDLVLCGHSHNYQRIKAPVTSTVTPPPKANKSYATDSYTLLVNGAGGVSSNKVRYTGIGPNGKRMDRHGHGAELLSWNGTDFGALVVIVDSNTREIKCEYHTVKPRNAEIEDFAPHDILDDTVSIPY